jgi:activator of HSP90 ATPase
MEKFTVTVVLPASPEDIYNTWFSSEGHSQMTGSPATVEAGIGGAFTAWDGYISGKTLELELYARIVQAWRTSEFPDDGSDSRVEILLEKAPKGTKVTLVHTDIPDGQGENYKKGWDDFYFTPMRAYFSK